MYSKILILRFPKTEVQKPIVCNLAKNFNLTFNILHATIFSRKEGQMVLELLGDEKNFDEGLAYLKDQGVKFKIAAQEINRDDYKCIQCGACTAVCPTGALFVNRPKMNILFEQEKCSICQLCVLTCPTRAMLVEFSSEAFFNGN